MRGVGNGWITFICVERYKGFSIKQVVLLMVMLIVRLLLTLIDELLNLSFALSQFKFVLLSFLKHCQTRCMFFCFYQVLAVVFDESLLSFF
jgi:hypothetical protein